MYGLDSNFHQLRDINIPRTTPHLLDLSKIGSFSSTRATRARISDSSASVLKSALTTEGVKDAFARAARMSMVDWERLEAMLSGR